MGEKFESIRSSAEITASSADDITEIIQQQAIASEQILIAIKQISAGVENFAVATDNISSSAEHIRSLSENLNDQVNSEQNAVDERKKKGKKVSSEESEKTE
jgi:methyl-accepting chemotaxis protein